MIQTAELETFAAAYRHGRRYLAAACLAGLALVGVSAPAASAETLRLMTQNMYQGAKFDPVFKAKTPEEFVAAITEVYNNILASNPAERAAAVANEIAAERPDIVGLQEASILCNGGAIATNVVSDQTQELLQRLADLGQEYQVVAVMPGTDAQAPTTLGFNARLTNRDVLIARADLADRQIKLTNVQVQQYLVNHGFSTAVGVPIIDTRGWASVDVEVGGHTLRVATTHLDSTLPVTVRQAQATELLATAAATEIPVVLIGDFNANASNNADPTFPTYQLLLSGGFADAWTERHPNRNGFTCCQSAKLQNPRSRLSARIDLILHRGAVSVLRIRRVGQTATDRTPSGLWPSDHAGVSATLQLN
jgi:endonuclease/exonuclease/phosphatase family metal-dependent hydrolase